MSQLKKKCKVVMLPTEKAIKDEDIILVKYLKHINWVLNNKLGFATKLAHQPKDTWWRGSGAIITKDVEEGNVKPQHLYTLSDDEIKEGDWVFNTYNNKSIFKIVRLLSDGCEGKKLDKDKIDSTCIYGLSITTLKKIIASTDPSLNIHWNKQDHKSLPTVSIFFINKYIEMYNKNTPITDVMVEYEEIRYMLGLDIDDNSKINYDIHINPKLRNNELIITRVKESWTREEVTALYKATCERLTNSYISSDIEWLENNLK